MVDSMSNEAKKRDTKKLILEKAYLLFLEKGYDSVSIRMIQEAVGIGRATMYHYFSSKKELFDAVIELNFRATNDTSDVSDYKDTLLSEHLKGRIEKSKDGT